MLLKLKGNVNHLRNLRISITHAPICGKLLIVVALFALVFLATSRAYADSISIGLSEDGAPITTVFTSAPGSRICFLCWRVWRF